MSTSNTILSEERDTNGKVINITILSKINVPNRILLDELHYFRSKKVCQAVFKKVISEKKAKIQNIQQDENNNP